MSGRAIKSGYDRPCAQGARGVRRRRAFRQCTPMGWTGSYEKWFQCLDLIIQLDPEVIVPGHGPLCGIEGRWR